MNCCITSTERAHLSPSAEGLSAVMVWHQSRIVVTVKNDSRLKILLENKVFKTRFRDVDLQIPMQIYRYQLIVVTFLRRNTAALTVAFSPGSVKWNPFLTPEHNFGVRSIWYTTVYTFIHTYIHEFTQQGSHLRIDFFHICYTSKCSSQWEVSHSILKPRRQVLSDFRPFFSCEKAVWKWTTFSDPFQTDGCLHFDGFSGDHTKAISFEVFKLVMRVCIKWWSMLVYFV